MSEKMDTGKGMRPVSEEQDAAALTPGLKAAVLGLLLLKVRAFLNPANVVKILAGAAVMGLIVFLWLGADGNQSVSEWLETTFLVYLMPLICLAIGGGAIRNEIKEFTIEYLWTRPLTRSQLLIGSYAASVTLCSILGIVFGSTIFGVGLLSGAAIGWEEYFSLIVAIFALSIAYVGISQLLGVVSEKYMVKGIVYGMLVEVGISQIPMNIRNLAVSHHLKTIYPGALAGDTNLLGALGMGFLPCVIIGASAVFLGCVVFSRRQYSVGGGS